jgi:hypothetical protein
VCSLLISVFTSLIYLSPILAWCFNIKLKIVIKCWNIVLNILDYVGNVLQIIERSTAAHSFAIHLQDINKGDPIKQIWEDGAMYYNFVYDFDYIQNCSMCFVPINCQIKDLRYKGHYNNWKNVKKLSDLYYAAIERFVPHVISYFFL